MKEQAGIYQEMASVLQKMAAEGNVETGAEELSELIASFQENRSSTAALPKPTEEEQISLGNLPELAEAHKAYLEAQSSFLNSQFSSSKISDILSGLRKSKPVAGEGRPQ